MEGTVSIIKTESPPRAFQGGTRKEVNIINEFTFDLQRFNGNSEKIWQIGSDTNKQYATLQEAITAASADDTLNLLADDNKSFAAVKIEQKTIYRNTDGNSTFTDPGNNAESMPVKVVTGNQVIIKKNLTIEGNGHTIYGLTAAEIKNVKNGTNYDGDVPLDEDSPPVLGIWVSGGNVTINNLKMSQFGDTDYVNKFGYVPIQTSSQYSGTLTLNNVDITNFNRQAICVRGGTGNITGGVITANAANKGTDYTQFQQPIEVRGGTATIKNVTITSSISHSNSDAGAIVTWRDITIEDVDINFTGKGIWSDGGTNGTTVKGNNTKVKTTSDALFAEEGYKINVEAGIYIGSVNVDNNANSTINITGGIFSQNTYTNNNSITYTEITGKTLDGEKCYSVGSASLETSAVAKVGEKYYTTLAAAIDAVGANETITLLKDISLSTITAITQTNDFTIDLAGHTWSRTTAGNVFRLDTNSGALTIKDTGTTKGKISSQGQGCYLYAGTNLTLEGVTIEASTHGIVNNGTVTMIDSTITANNSDCYGVIVYSGAEFTMNGGTIDAVSAGYGVCVNSGAKFTMNSGKIKAAKNGVEVVAQKNGTVATAEILGGTIEAAYGGTGVLVLGNGTNDSAVLTVGKEGQTESEEPKISVAGNGFAISGNGSQGSNDYRGTKITINSGTFTAKAEDSKYNNNILTDDKTAALALYQPQAGTLTINGGTFTGDQGIEIRSGTVDINGGTFESTYGKYVYFPNGNGNTTVGTGIAVAQHTTENPIILNINSDKVTVKGQVALSVTNPQNNDEKAPVVNIKGGTFEGKLNEAISSENTDSRVVINISGGKFNNDLLTKLTDRTASSASAALGYNISGNSATFSTFTFTSGKDLLALERAGGGSLYNIGVEGWNGGTANTPSTSWAYVAAGSQSYIGEVVLNVTGSKSIALNQLGFDSATSLLGIPDKAGGLSSWSWGTGFTNAGGTSYFLASFSIANNVIELTPLTTGVSIMGASSIFGTNANNITKLTALGSSGIYVDASLNKLNDITGGEGNDTLKAGNRASTLFGGEGNDKLYGASSADYLFGGAGNDYMFGGSGADTFVFGGGNDTIADYEFGVDALSGITSAPTLAMSAGTSGMVLGFANGDSITFASASKVSLTVSGNTTPYVYTWDFVEHDTGATLFPHATGYKAASGIETIYATNADLKNVSVIGNSLDNFIYGGTSVSYISGGGGSDWVSLMSGALVDVSEGNDTINVAAGVQAFSVSGFSTGDVIKLDSSFTTGNAKLESVTGGISIGGLTITGIDAFASLTADWTTGTASIAWQQWTTAGASLSGQEIKLQAEGNKTALFTITGISSSTGVTLNETTKVITLGASALAGLTTEGASIALNNVLGEGYKLAIAEGLSTSAGTLSPYWTLDSGKASYMTGASGAYYALTNNTLVSYVAQTGGTSAIILSGVANKDGLSLAGEVVSLNTAAFGTNGITVESYTGNYSFSIASATGDAYKGKTFTGTSSNDTIVNFGAGLTIFGMSGADSISNSGANVSIDGGAGNDWIDLLKGENASVNVSEGNDTVSVATGISAFAVAGFSAGDEIQFASAITGGLSLSTDYSAVIAGDVTISGLTVTVGGQSWHAGSASNSIRYDNWMKIGAALDGTSKILTGSGSTNIDTGTNVFTITGLSLADAQYITVVANKYVTLGMSALAGISTIMLSNKDYALVLENGVPTSATAGGTSWTTTESGIRYGETGGSSYYSLSKDQLSVTYVEAVAGSGAVELSGATGHPTIVENVIGLSAANFAAAPVSVVSNVNGYAFSLSSDITGKLFAGGASADTIISNGATVSISGGGGSDLISLGSGGTETIIQSTGSDTLEGYDGTNDLIRFDSVTTASYGTEGVTFESGTNKLLVKKTDSSAKGVKVKQQTGTGTTQTIDYYANASGTESILTIYDNLQDNVTLSASDYDNSYSKVDVGAVTGTPLTLKDFKTIKNFNEDYHVISGVPQDAASIGSDLVITLDSGTVTVEGAAKTTVKLSNGTKNYTAQVGIITNVTDSIVALTNNYTSNAYTAEATVKTVDAQKVTSAISLNGIAAGNITLLGGSGNDTLIGGTYLNGGAGNDYASLVGAATVDVSLGNDTVDVGKAQLVTVTGFGNGDVIQLTSSVSKLSSDANKNIIAGNVTISGLDLASTTEEWQTSGQSAARVATSNGGPGLSNDHTQITYQNVTSNPLFTIDGVSAIENASISGTVVTLGKANLAGMSIRLIAGTSNEYTLALDGNYESSVEAAGGFTQTGQSATYTDAGRTAGYSVAEGGKEIEYTASVEGAALFTIEGISTIENSAVSGTTVTLGKENLASMNVTLTNLGSATYALALSGVETVATDESGWTEIAAGKTSYVDGATSEYYAQEGATQITYHAAVAGTSTVELSGVSAGASLAAPAEGVVNLTASDFGTGIKVENNAGSYAFNLATGDYAGKSFTGTDAADTITSSGTNVSIDGGLGNDAINLANGTGATVNVGGGNDTISVESAVTAFTVAEFAKGDVIALATAPSALEKVEGGVKAGDLTITGINEVATVTNKWHEGETLTYVSEATSGAKLVDKEITLVEAEGATDTLFTVYGVGQSAGVTLENMTVTLGKTVLDTKTAGATVALSGAGYSLAITGVTMSASVISAAGFSGAIYSASALGEYWSADGTNAYKLNASTAGAAQFSIAGATALADSLVSDTTVTLGKANLAGMSITLTNTAGNSYALSLEGDFAQSVTAAGFGKLVDNAVTYYGEGKTEGYALSSATLIAHRVEEKGEEFFTASNITSADNVKYEDGAITATNDTGAKLTLTKMADEKLTLGGFAEIDKLNATNHTVAGTPTDAKADGSNLLVTTAEGVITIDGASSATVNLTGASAAYTAAFDRITDVTNTNAKSVTLTTGFTNNYYGLHYSYANGVTAVDATNANTATLNLTGSKSSLDLKLTGAAKATNTLTGGSGNDTLTGGTGNDHLKGNAGSDLFVQSAGDDTIINYVTGEDKISLVSALKNSEVINDDVKLTTEDGNSVLILQGNGQGIDVIDANGKESTLLFLGSAPTNASVNGENLIVTTAEGDATFAGSASATVTVSADGRTYEIEATRITDTTDSAKKVTLTTDFTKDYYGLHQSYGKGVTAVDATKADTTELTLTGYKSSNDLELTGAAKAANTLIGGSGNDTLTGGEAADQLKGNAGNDLFIQSAGDDTITDYTAGEDKISLTSALANYEAINDDVKLTTANGTILILDGNGADIAVIDADGEEKTIKLVSGVPKNASVSGSDLVIEFADGRSATYPSAASDTVTIEYEGKTYAVEATRITDVTDADAKAVTLTTGFTGAYYGLHQSYGTGVYSVDATQADTDSLALTAYKSTVGVVLTGAADATNTITGGKADDTLKGGSGNDSLKGNAGFDSFMQSGGNDTIGDYTEGEDVIELLEEATVATVGSNVRYTNGDGTILVVGGASMAITTVIGGITIAKPVDASVRGDDLAVKMANGRTTVFADAANDTVTLEADGRTYTAASDRIENITNANAKAVTLTAGFDGTYYGLHQSYANGVHSVDASKAKVQTTLTLTGYKSEVGIVLKGADNAPNSIIGGKGGDTLTGGTLNDTLKGNVNNDLFIQTAGEDTIVDYAPGEDKISLASALSTYTIEGSNVILTTEDKNTIIVTGGKDQEITTIFDGKESKEVYSEHVNAGAPVDSSVKGNDLVITYADGRTSVSTDNAENTVSFGSEGQTFTVAKDRITDVTDENDKKVTLTSGFDGTYYGMHYSYSKNVTAVDASKANGESLNIAGHKASIGLSLKGSDNVGSTVTGGKVADTIVGGTKDDTLKGNAGADTFVQTAGNDVISDYATEDVIVLQSALTETVGDKTNVTLTTADGSIVLENAVNKNITTKVGEDGEASTMLFFSEMPTNVRTASGNLIASVAGSRVTLGAASDTVEFSVGESKYTAAADRITDVTDANAKSVTLTSSFTKGYYGLHYSYADGVTAVDATEANTTSLNIAGFKSEVGLKLKGADKANTSLLGGKGNDTLIGGDGDDTLKGNAGADLFVQSKGDDVIVDYAEEDTIQLASTAESSVDGQDILFTNTTGTIRVSLGSGLDINTVVGGDANFATNDDELWGVNGVKDEFLFDGGKDTIHNYEAQDEINLGGYSLSELVNGAPSVSDNSLIFAFDKKNSFTVVDAVGKDISFTDGSTYSSKRK